jgi:phosphonate transport system substrate-binding protein
MIRARVREVRIGVTAVFPEDQVGMLHLWRNWLEDRLRRPVAFVTRSSYREIVDMVRAGQIDFAWICGYPYVRYQRELRLVAAPLWQGRPLYRSYIIVASDDARSSLLDLEGRVFAYSDPDSNSGYLYPRHVLISAARDPDAFFRRSFFTWAHRQVVRAVAEGVAQGGAVDGYVYELVATLEPKLVARTRVIQRSPWFGHPPVVARHDISAEEFRAFFQALAMMSSDEQGRSLLRAMQLDGFVHAEQSLYSQIAEMMRADAAFRSSRRLAKS